jgi:hypothetical protein
MDLRIRLIGLDWTQLWGDFLALLEFADFRHPRERPTMAMLERLAQHLLCICYGHTARKKPLTYLDQKGIIPQCFSIANEVGVAEFRA